MEEEVAAVAPLEEAEGVEGSSAPRTITLQTILESRVLHWMHGSKMCKCFWRVATRR